MKIYFTKGVSPFLFIGLIFNSVVTRLSIIFELFVLARLCKTAKI